MQTTILKYSPEFPCYGSFSRQRKKSADGQAVSLWSDYKLTPVKARVLGHANRVLSGSAIVPSHSPMTFDGLVLVKPL